MQVYVAAKYGSLLHNVQRETVSVHFRLGGPDEARMSTVLTRGYPSLKWFAHVMTKILDPARVVFVIFSDNIPSAKKMLDAIPHADLQYQVVDEDFATTLLVMSRCKHHVSTVSSYSFWGAYLDKHQPTGGRSFFHPNFQSLHDIADLPFKEWEVIPEPK
jgi:hypothetical protein